MKPKIEITDDKMGIMTKRIPDFEIGMYYQYSLIIPVDSEKQAEALKAQILDNEKIVERTRKQLKELQKSRRTIGCDYNISQELVVRYVKEILGEEK